MAPQNPPPGEMLGYLLDLISPPGQRAIYWDSLDVNWSGFKDDSLCGVIVRGTPTEKESAQILRILKPGAHLLLIAPDEEPTGHTGACNIEDVGFEIRDALLWVREPGRSHYVPKASRSEREAGCSHLKGKTGAQSVERQEGTDGLNSPRAGAGRTAEHVKNFHPTVKAIGIMEALLTDVPKDRGPVVDPFVGSGTTAVACLRTGHDFVGIDREEDYLEIADARVQFWEGETRAVRNWRQPDIESDVDSTPKPPEEPMDILDFFYGDDE